MKCKFCPESEIFHQSSTSGKNNSGIATTVCTYHCPQCESSMFYQDDKRVGWQFLVDFKEDRFFICWTSGNDITEISAYDLKGAGGLRLKLKLNGEMSLTPSNISRRLPTILTFQ